MRFLFWGLLLLLVVIRFFSVREDYIDGQKVRVRGTITAEPIRFSNYQTLSLAGLKISLPAYPEIHYGDSVELEGTVAARTLKNPITKNIGAGENFLTNFRNSLINFYQKSLPEPHASLIAGIVLGARGSLPPNFWTSLKNSGVMHVVVASGMNVSISAGVFMGLALLFLPRRKAIPFALLAIWIYVFLSGIQPPIIRAAIMGSVLFVGQAMGRVSSAWTALVLSALIMLIIAPSWIGDIGFILSFVATASLMLFERRVEGRLGALPNFLEFRRGFSTALAAQLGVAPILFATFGQFNILSPVVNALVLWTVPYIMIIGTVGGAVGLVSPVLGQGVLYLAYPLTWWFVSIVQLFG